MKQVKPLAKNKGVIVLPEKTFKSVVSTAADLNKIQKERRRTSGEDEIDFVSSIGDATKIAAKVQNEILDYADEVIPTLKGKPLYTQLSKVIRPLASVNRETAEIYDELTKMFGKMKGNPLFNSTLMSLYFRAREYENNPNKDVNKNPIEYIDATIRSEKTPYDKRIVLKEMKEEYFVKGNPKTQMMRLELDKRRGDKVIDYMDGVMSNFAPDVRFMAEVEAGKSFDFVFNYQPRATIESGSKPLNEVLNSIGPGSRKPSLKTSAIEDRKTQANALTFDAFDDFMRTVSSVHMQRDVAPAMNEISAFISAARRSGNDDAITFASVLEQTVKGYVEASLSKQYTERNYLGNLGVKAGSKMKRNILSGITKPIVEGTIQVAKLAIDADTNAGFMEYLDKAPKEHTNKEVLSVLKSVHAHRAGILSAEMARERSYLADQVRRGTANTAEKMMYGLASSTVAKGVTGTDKLLGEFNTALIKSPDLMGRLPQVVLGATSLKFKEITGKNIDFDKVASDPLYRAKYKDALDLAISYGDQIGTRLSGPGAMEQRSIADIKAIGPLNQPLNRFVRSFSTNESNQIQSAVATIAPVSTKINRKERGAEFDDKKKAARGFAASMVGLAGYKLARIVGSNLMYALASALLSDDDDELFEDWDWEEVSAMLLADAVWTSLFGKYGVLESLIVQSLIVTGMKLSAKGTDQEERANKISDAMFYSTVDSKTPFGVAVGSLGAEGKIVSSMLELGSIISEGEFDTGQYSTRRALYANYMWFGNIPGQQDLGKILKKRWRDESINMKFNQAFGRASRPGQKPNSYKIRNTEERLLMKLYEKTGDRYLIPSLVSDKRTIKGDRYFINASYQKELQAVKASYVVKQISDVKSDSKFRNSSESSQAEILKKAMRGFGSKEDFPNRLKDRDIKSLNDYYKKYGTKVDVD